jgi:hypothetical protein
MAIVTIPQNPELTKEQALEAFQRRFAATYEVYPTKLAKRDLIVKKSNFAGVGVRLKQEKEKTSFVFTAMMPNVIMQALFGGLFSYLILRSEWKRLEAEVTEFIESAPEFHPQPKPKTKRTPKSEAEQQAA